MNINNNTFGTKLNTLKTARNFSSAELARRAGISEGLLSGLIHDQRVIGEYTARKLGNALQLQGDQLQDFVYLAINNCSEKVLDSSKAYPAEVLNLIAGELNALGISSCRIKQCVRKSDSADAELHLDNGEMAYINVEVCIQ